MRSIPLIDMKRSIHTSISIGFWHLSNMNKHIKTNKGTSFYIRGGRYVSRLTDVHVCGSVNASNIAFDAWDFINHDYDEQTSSSAFGIRAFRRKL